MREHQERRERERTAARIFKERMRDSMASLENERTARAFNASGIFRPFTCVGGRRT